MRFQVQKMAFVAMTLTAQTLWAQQGSSTSKAVAPAPKEPAFSGSFTVDRGTSLIDWQDGTRQDSLDLGAELGFKFNPTYSGRVILAYSHDLNDSEAHGFADTTFVFSRKGWSLSKSWELKPSLIEIFPTSDDSAKVQNLLFGTGAGIGLGLKPEAVPGLSFGVSVNLIKLIHQYTTKTDDTPNKEYSSKQAMTLGYSVGDFSMGLALAHRDGVSYFGVTSESFEHAESLSYQASENIGINLAHSLAGPVYKANSRDSNVSLWNEDASMVSLGLKVGF